LVTLTEIYRMVMSEIQDYIKWCEKKGVKIDYNYIKKYYKRRSRELAWSTYH